MVQDAGQQGESPSVQVVGHRGAAGLWPENTLRGLRAAVDLGVDAVECDVHRTVDGALAVIHDAHLERTTNGHGPVAALNREQLRRLDAGGGEPIPLLEEVLQAVGGRVPLLVELKAAGTAAPALQAVRRAGLQDRVTFIAFREDWLQEIMRLRDGAAVGLISAEPPSAAGDLPPAIPRAAALGAAWVDLHFPLLTSAVVRAAHARGLRVRVWTPNSPAEQEAVLGLGPDAVTTDRPDRLLRRLGRRA